MMMYQLHFIPAVPALHDWGTHVFGNSTFESSLTVLSSFSSGDTLMHPRIVHCDYHPQQEPRSLPSYTTAGELWAMNDLTGHQ